MSPRPTPSNGVLLWRGATRACPVCGRRRLTSRWVVLAEDCPRCGFRFERKPGHFVGAVGMSTIFTFGVILLTLLGGIAVQWPDIRVLPLLTVLLPIAVFAPILFHPTAKLIWVAIDLMMNPVVAGEAVGGPEERALQKR